MFNSRKKEERHDDASFLGLKFLERKTHRDVVSCSYSFYVRTYIRTIAGSEIFSVRNVDVRRWSSQGNFETRNGRGQILFFNICKCFTKSSNIILKREREAKIRKLKERRKNINEL